MSRKSIPLSKPRRTKVDESTARRLELIADVRGGEASERPDARTSERPERPKGPGITWRDGRVLADGTRRGAGWVRRMTVYVPPELGRVLDTRAVEAGEEKSAIVAAALAAYLA